MSWTLITKVVYWCTLVCWWTGKRHCILHTMSPSLVLKMVRWEPFVNNQLYLATSVNHICLWSTWNLVKPEYPCHSFKMWLSTTNHTRRALIILRPLQMETIASVKCQNSRGPIKVQIYKGVPPPLLEMESNYQILNPGSATAKINGSPL